MSCRRLGWFALVLVGCGNDAPQASDPGERSILTEPEGDTPEPATCLDGDTRTCVGSGACDGGQFCENGIWSRCDCGTSVPGSNQGSAGTGSQGDPQSPTSVPQVSPAGGTGGDSTEVTPAGGTSGNSAAGSGGGATGPDGSQQYEEFLVVPDTDGYVSLPAIGIEGFWTFFPAEACTTDQTGPSVSNPQTVPAADDGRVCIGATWRGGCDTWGAPQLFLSLNQPDAQGPRGEYNPSTHGVIGFAYEFEATGVGYPGGESDNAQTFVLLLSTNGGFYYQESLSVAPPPASHVFSWLPGVLNDAQIPDFAESTEGFFPDQLDSLSFYVRDTVADPGEPFEICVSNLRVLLAQ